MFLTMFLNYDLLSLAQYPKAASILSHKSEWFGMPGSFKNKLSSTRYLKTTLLDWIRFSYDILMSKFNISEGKVLGNKLKIIEDEWVKNNFQISDKQVENIIKD